MTRRVGCAFLVLALGCGDDDLRNAHPTGVLQGEVRDGISGATLEGATVSVVVEGEARTSATDATGWFVMDGLPAGSNLTADVSAAGYATVRIDVMIDDSAGEHPQSNSIDSLLIQLFQNPHTLLVVVTDRASDEGAENVIVTARNGCPGEGDGNILGTLSATTGETGEATLEGLATGQAYELTAVPNDTYYSTSECFTQGESFEPVELFVVPRSCDGEPDFCCSWDDPCGRSGDNACDCSGCAWDEADCL